MLKESDHCRSNLFTESKRPPVLLFGFRFRLGFLLLSEKAEWTLLLFQVRIVRHSSCSLPAVIVKYKICLELF